MRTKWLSLSWSLNVKSLKSYHIQRISMRVCGSIAQRSVFIQPCNHRLLTTEKVVDECRAMKLVNKCSHKNCLRLELFDCEQVFCVEVELQCSIYFLFEQSRYAWTTSLGVDCCLSKREPFFRVYTLSSKHNRKLGEFWKVMQTRHAP